MINSEKILITGSEGFLGGHMLRAARMGKIDAIGTDVHLLDITDESKVLEFVRKEKPTIIIHCAAVSTIEACFLDKELATKVNVDGTKNLAKAAKELGSHFVLISTDLVFDGNKGDYTVKDTPNPINHYAKTKRAAEVALQEISEKFAIVRLSWCYGFSVNSAKNYLDKFIVALKNGQMQELFVDEFRTPIAVERAVERILELSTKKISGIFHLAGEQKLSRYEFGLKIAERYNLDKSLIIKAKSSEKSFSESRPLDTSLIS